MTPGSALMAEHGVAPGEDGQLPQCNFDTISPSQFTMSNDLPSSEPPAQLASSVSVLAPRVPSGRPALRARCGWLTPLARAVTGLETTSFDNNDGWLTDAQGDAASHGFTGFACPSFSPFANGCAPRSP